MHLDADALTIPNPRKEGELRLRFVMTNISNAEARVSEIAFVNPQRAPELMAAFSLAIRDLAQHTAFLQYHLAMASKMKRQRRAVVVTELIPTKLADKKLSNNDTNREALVELDPEYSAVTDVEIEIEAAFVFIREKLRSMESHLNAVKKSLDATHSVFNQPNPKLVQPLGNEGFSTKPQPLPPDAFTGIIGGPARHETIGYVADYAPPESTTIPVQTEITTTKKLSNGLIIGKAKY